MVPFFFGRQQNILDYALSSLWRNRLKNLGIVVVFSLVIFMIASFRLVVSGLDRATQELMTSVPDIIVQQMTAGRQVSIDTAVINELDSIFGIAAIHPRVWGYYFDESNGANYTVIGDDRFTTDTEMAGLGIEYGDRTDRSYNSASVVIGQSVTTQLMLGGRRNFSLFRPDLSLKAFQRVGEFSRKTAMVSDDLIVMHIEAARDLFDMRSSEVTDLLVSVVNPAEIDTIARKISENIDGSRVITKRQVAKTYRAAFGWRSGVGLACLFGAIAAFVILAWDKASGLSPDQRREVGILKAVGWQTGDVMTLRFWESVVVSLSAFVLGYGLAWLHILFFNGMLYRPVLLGWSVLRPSLTLMPVLRIDDLLLIFSLSILPYLAATVIPAWHSAMVRPDSVV